MNGSARLLGLLILLITLSAGVLAREAVPIINYDDIMVAGSSSHQLSADQVRDAIINAARINQWVVSKESDQNVLSATLFVNGKHTVVVSIPYSAEKFSIKYQDSINMKYSVSSPAVVESSSDITNINRPVKNPAASPPMIHPAYNKWVQALLQSIRLQLSKL